jgi:hypothetical protein
MRPMPRSTATPSPPASNPTSMRRGCCDVDVPRSVTQVSRLLSVRRILTQSAPHTMGATGQEDPLQAQALHRTAHPDALASRS